MQIKIPLNKIVKSIKNREERRNGYLLLLKCPFCYTEKSGMREIYAESHSNKQRVISSFLHDLQVTHCIGEFPDNLRNYSELLQKVKSYRCLNFHKMNQDWAGALKVGSSVKGDITSNYPGNSVRPDSFKVDYWIGEEKSTKIIKK